MVKRNLIVSAEHGGNIIPLELKKILNIPQKVLESHRGFDRGSLELAKKISRAFSVPLYFSNISRLVVDIDCAKRNTAFLYSSYTRRFDKSLREQVLKDYYFSYYKQIEEAIKKRKPVFHLSVHSFTPVFHGKTRTTDIGILYHAYRDEETNFCKVLKGKLQDKFPKFNINSNQPYTAEQDNIILVLEKKFDKKDYIGISIDINHKHVSASITWKKIQRGIAQAYKETFKEIYG